MLDLAPSMIISHIIVLFISFPVHELAHAWTAELLGDDTPRLHGRLTLNPLAHLDPMGSLLLVAAGFGWAKPVPVNPYALQRRSPAGMMWVSIAGPLSNLGMAIIAAIPFRLGFVSLYDAQVALFDSRAHFLPTIPQLLWVFVYLNLLLMLFNLLPIAPLDGDKIAAYFFPPAWSRVLDRIRPYGPMILLVVIFLGVIGWIINPPLTFLLRILVG